MGCRVQRSLRQIAAFPSRHNRGGGSPCLYLVRSHTVGKKKTLLWTMCKDSVSFSVAAPESIAIANEKENNSRSPIQRQIHKQNNTDSHPIFIAHHRCGVVHTSSTTTTRPLWVWWWYGRSNPIPSPNPTGIGIPIPSSVHSLWAPVLPGDFLREAFLLSRRETESGEERGLLRV